MILKRISSIILAAALVFGSFSAQVFANQTPDTYFSQLQISAHGISVEQVKDANGNVFVYGVPDNTVEYPYLQTEIPVPAGTVSMFLKAKSGNNRGMYAVYLDDEYKGIVDFYEKTVGDAEYIVCQLVSEQERTATLKLIATDKNVQSVGNSCALYAIRFEDASYAGNTMTDAEKKIAAVPPVDHPLYNEEEKPVMQRFYVDPVNGRDENDGSLQAPFQTLVHARDMVREINSNMTGNIEVILRGGVYRLDRTTRTQELYGPANPEDANASLAVSPSYERELRELRVVSQSTFQLNERDSGSNGYQVKYMAYEGETPVLSGEDVISGWTVFDREKNIYRAPANGIKTRNLYVNGKRAQRAASAKPDGVNFHTLLNNCEVTDEGLITTDDYFMNWGNIQGLEFVFTDAAWWSPHVKTDRIYKNNDGKTVIVLQQPGWYFLRNKAHMTIQKGPCYMENAFELLDEAGEWYLDHEADVIYYKPEDGVTPQELQITAGIVEELMLLTGRSADHPVRDIVFHGLTFRGTTWLRPETANGHSDAQSNRIREGQSTNVTWNEPEAAIYMKYAHRIKFERCTLEAMASTGLLMHTGCHDCLFIGNRVNDIGGSGVIIGAADHESKILTDEGEMVVNCDVISNCFTKCAQEYFSGVAVSIGVPNDTNVSYNEVSDMVYSGFHLGASFYGDEELAVKERMFKNAKIQNNFLYATNKILTDGAPIYTCGANYATENNPNVITGNYISSLGYSGAIAGLYNDSGTNNFLNYGNFVQGYEYGLLLNVYHSELASVKNYADVTAQYFIPGDKDDLPFLFTLQQNMINGSGPDGYPQAVTDIMKHAGLLEQYRDLSTVPEGEIFSVVPKQRKFRLDSSSEQLQKLEFDAYDRYGNRVDNSDMTYQYHLYKSRLDGVFLDYMTNDLQTIQFQTGPVTNADLDVLIDENNSIYALGVQRTRIWVEAEQDGKKYHTLVSVVPSLENNVVIDGIAHRTTDGVTITKYFTADGVYDHILYFKRVGDYIEYDIELPKVPGTYDIIAWMPGSGGIAGGKRGIFKVYVDGEETCITDRWASPELYERLGRVTVDASNLNEIVTVRLEYMGKNPQSTTQGLTMYGFEFEPVSEFGSAVILANGTSRIIKDNERVAIDNGKCVRSINDTYYVPVELFSALGGSVSTTADGGAAVVYAGKELTIPAAGYSVTMNGTQQSLQHEIVSAEGTIYVPLRSVCSALGMQVKWYEEDFAVIGDTTPFDADLILRYKAKRAVMVRF